MDATSHPHSHNWWQEGRFNQAIEHAAILVDKRIPQLEHKIEAYNQARAETSTDGSLPRGLAPITDQIRSTIRRISISLSLIVRELDKEPGAWQQWQRLPGLANVHTALTEINWSWMGNDKNLQDHFEQTMSHFWQRTSASQHPYPRGLPCKRRRSLPEFETHQSPASKKWRHDGPDSGQDYDQGRQGTSKKKKKVVMTFTVSFELGIVDGEQDSNR
ncbi:hypothetical protein BD289DRAFT_481917 [Coniella lustricola]|uniref:Uncharacterized protein n=1 Tax=Coniella lustricola TaxID=2025994 RepID=A0A2T3AAJ7_9PEZI|nr:hypothetical protein BD289DRAFT_481917 [Coniella lustricola]